MGTRHQQKVIDKKGQVKINQYGQWDGYPSGQGKGILNFLRNSDLETYQKNLENVYQAKQEDYDKVIRFEEKVKNKKLLPEKEREELQANSEYYALHRDCGSNIHNLIYNGSVKAVEFIDDKEAYKWCDGFYTIDFQNNIFVSEFDGITVKFLLNDLPTEEDYLKTFENNENF